MINPKNWTEKQTNFVNAILYRIEKLATETWDDELNTVYFLDNVYMKENEMEFLKELIK